jgi:hypothetical protein
VYSGGQSPYSWRQYGSRNAGLCFAAEYLKFHCLFSNGRRPGF